jgi:chromate reductase
MHLVVVPGTNRRGAYSAILAKLVVAELLTGSNTVDLLELDLGAEFLAADAYSAPQPAVKKLVDRFLAADGVVFIVPEYNGSYPGVLKLFIDMLPYPQGFDQRPCAFIGLSAGQFQSLRAVEHLQGVTGYRHAYNFPVRIFIGDSKRAFSPEGQLVDRKLAERLTAQATGFVRFIARMKHDPAHG